MSRLKTLCWLSIIALFATQSTASGQSGRGGQAVGGSSPTLPGVSASSPGSAGMSDDDDGPYLQDLQKAKKNGLKSRDYIESLIAAGLHYNRTNKYNEADKTLSEALKIIDDGALKPTAGSVEEKSPTVVQHADGTVSATINKPSAPYEETLEQLLPALVTADLNSNKLTAGEVHVKRLIDLAEHNRIHRVPALVMAYHQYAELLTKMKRPGEAAHYRAEAEKINKTIQGL